MPDRNSLHQLVDTLPEAALEMVARALGRLQNWPPQMPRKAQEMQELAQEILAKRTWRCPEVRGGKGCTRGTAGGGCWTADGDGAATANGTIDRTHVRIEVRRFRGHQLQIEKQLGMSDDQRKLRYALLIKGPDGKEGYREIEFDIAGDASPTLKEPSER